MSILDRIVEQKKSEVAGRKHLFSIADLESSSFYREKRPSFYDAMAADGPSVIGEFKRRSPSKGILNIIAEVEEVARGYEKAGIAAMSILTDMEFFGGDDEDLRLVAGFSGLPLLRKDFIIDEYQVIESKSLGASAILLIASILTRKQVSSYTRLAHEVGLDVLFEVHDRDDLTKITPEINIVGINNRNLKTFEVDIEQSVELFEKIPESCLKVAESGFRAQKDVSRLYQMGYDGFLIGENFMRAKDPGKAALKFLNAVNKLL